MAMTSCRECGKEISDTAKTCPHCGAGVPRTKWWLWVPLGLVVAFLAFGALVGNSPEAREKAKERAAIDLCWDGHERKSLEPDTQRFIAQVCEKMESDFQLKHGHRP